MMTGQDEAENAQAFVRCAACHSLCCMGIHGAHAAAGMLRDTDSDVRIRCLKVLASMQEAGRVYAAKVAASLEDEVGEVRLAALEALFGMQEAGLGHGVAVVATMQDSDSNIRVAACKVIGHLGVLTVRAAAKEAALLQQMSDSSMREAACNAGMLRDSDSNIRIACKGKCKTLGLGLAGSGFADRDRGHIHETGNAHQAVVAAALLSDRDRRVRLEAIRAIGAIAEPTAEHARALGSMAVDENVFVQEAATEVLAGIELAVSVYAEIAAELIENSASDTEMRHAAKGTTELLGRVFGEGVGVHVGVGVGVALGAAQQTANWDSQPPQLQPQ
jgi:hypothetical protein